MCGCGDSPLIEKKSSDAATQGNHQLQHDLVFPVSEIRVHALWKNEGPKIVEESSLIAVLLAPNDSKLAEELDLKLEIVMPEMGCRSYPITVEKKANGFYEASDIYFTMTGYWDVHFQLYQDGVFLEEIKWPLNL